MTREPLLPNASGNLVDDGINITWRSTDHDFEFPCLCRADCSASSWKSGFSHISFHSILWCETYPGSEDTFELTYLSFEDRDYQVRKCLVQLSGLGYQDADKYAEEILASAFYGSFSQPKILLLLNTKGGKGDAASSYKKKIKPILQAAHIDFTCIETTHSNHASEIGEGVDINKFDIVACCSGDGIPHEFINGLYKRPDNAEALSKLAITQIPCGSGNAFSLSTFGTTNPALATLEMLKLKEIRMDAMLIQQGHTLSLSFLSQAYGAIADSDIGTEHLRWMGSVRFILGLAYKVFTRENYPCDLYVKYAIENKRDVQDHFRRYKRFQDSMDNKGRHQVTTEDLRAKLPGLDSPVPSDWLELPTGEMDKLSILYVGNMPYVLTDAQFFPAAICDDGYMDLVLFKSEMSILNYTSVLLNVSNGGHVNDEDVRHAKITAYRLVPRVDPTKHFISIDGESFPVEPLQVEVLSLVLKVLLKDKFFVDTRFGEH